MRLAIAVGRSRDRWERVHGVIGEVSQLRTLIYDRRANGDSLLREHVVRLPRRISRRIARARVGAYPVLLGSAIRGNL